VTNTDRQTDSQTDGRTPHDSKDSAMQSRAGKKSWKTGSHVPRVHWECRGWASALHDW